MSESLSTDLPVEVYIGHSTLGTEEEDEITVLSISIPDGP